MHRHRRYFDATLRCPVVNESENKLVGRFHRKMQFTPFMEPGPSRACVCTHVRTRVYICMHECVCACAHRNGRSRGLDHGRHLNYVSRPILNSLSFSPLTRVSFLETVRGMHAPPPVHRSDIGIIFFSPSPPLPFPRSTFVISVNWRSTEQKQKKKKGKKSSFYPGVTWRVACRLVVVVFVVFTRGAEPLTPSLNFFTLGSRIN